MKVSVSKIIFTGSLILGFSFPFQAKAATGQYACKITNATAEQVAAVLNGMRCDFSKPVNITVNDSSTNNTVDAYLVCCVEK